MFIKHSRSSLCEWVANVALNGLTFNVLDTILVTNTLKTAFFNVYILMIQGDLLDSGNVFKKLKHDSIIIDC